MKNIALKILLILSPVLLMYLISWLWILLNGPGGQEAFGVAIVGVFILLVPFVAITGFVAGYIIKKKRNLESSPVYAYVLSAAISWLLLLLLYFL